MTPGRADDARARPARDTTGEPPPPGYDRTGAWTVPNVLGVIRVAGSFVLLGLAATDRPHWFVGLFVFLLLTDWVDGKIAVHFHQRTVLGARLDSFADAVLYACLVIGTAWLDPGILADHAVLLGVMVGTYVASGIIALVRFGRLPAYHTRAAKTCWLLVAIGAVILLSGGPSWPTTVAISAVVLTNLEAIAIGLTLPRWRSDVVSLYHVLRDRRREAADEADETATQPAAPADGETAR